MPTPDVAVLARALKILLAHYGWGQSEFARKAEISRTTLHRLLKGKGLDRARLEELGALIGAPPARIEAAITFAATEDLPGEAGARLWHRRTLLADSIARTTTELRDYLSGRLQEIEVQARRDEAVRLWRRIEPLSAKQRTLLVAPCDEYWNVAFIAQLCEESARAAARDAAKSLEIAELALQVAKVAPGNERLKAGRQGYAWAFAGNAHRVGNRPGAADAAFERCRALFPPGGGEEKDFLSPSRVLDLEASLRRNQGRFGEALAHHKQALEICFSALRPCLLLNQATTLEQAGDPLAAIASLREARPAIERGEGGSRARFMLRFNLVKCLIHLERPSEAEFILPELWGLGQELGNRLDFLRTRALAAQVLAATGRPKDALVEFEAVREEFRTIPLPADAAIVALHEAEILLSEGRTAEVRGLVQSMRPIFDALRLKREALAAVRLFVEAAERDAATAAMAREAALCLCRVPRYA